MNLSGRVKSRHTVLTILHKNTSFFYISENEKLVSSVHLNFKAIGDGKDMKL